MHEKKPIPVDELDFDVGYALKYSDGAGNLTAAETTGAHINVLRSTVNNSFDTLNIGLPCTVGTSVRMAHFNTKGNALIAKFTLCHLCCTSMYHNQN